MEICPEYLTQKQTNLTPRSHYIIGNCDTTENFLFNYFLTYVTGVVQADN
jgi:hypothetical protein